MHVFVLRVNIMFITSVLFCWYFILCNNRHSWNL